MQLLITPESVSDFNLVNDTILPELRQLLRVDGNQKAQERIVQLVDQLSQLCITTNCMQPQLSRANETNQVMLYNFGQINLPTSLVQSSFVHVFQVLCRKF